MSLSRENLTYAKIYPAESIKGPKEVGAVNVQDGYKPCRLYFATEDCRFIPVRSANDVARLSGESFTTAAYDMAGILESYFPTNFQFRYKLSQLRDYVFPYVRMSRPENRYTVPAHMRPYYHDLLTDDGKIDPERRDQAVAAETLMPSRNFERLQQDALLYPNRIHSPNLSTLEKMQMYGLKWALVGGGIGGGIGAFYWYGLQLGSHYLTLSLISGTAFRFGAAAGVYGASNAGISSKFNANQDNYLTHTLAGFLGGLVPGALVRRPYLMASQSFLGALLAASVHYFERQAWIMDVKDDMSSQSPMLLSQK